VNLYQHTGLGRHLDVRLLSNRIAVVGTGLVGVLALTLRWVLAADFDLLADGYDAIATAVGVFLAWAVARELDPDRPGTATVAMVVAAVLSLLGTPAPGIVAVVLLGLRILVGSVGSRLRPADIVVLLAAAAYAGTKPEAWPAAAALVIATAIARPTRNAALSIGLGATATTAAMLSSPPATLAAPSATSLAVLVMAAAAIVVGGRVAEVASTDDRGAATISAGRVSGARILAGVVVIVCSTLTGGAVAVSPIVASLVAVALPTRKAPTRSAAAELNA
jgi:hypothetical protein